MKDSGKGRKQEPEEQVVPLRVIQEDGAPHDVEEEPEDREQTEQEKIEDFWAGRNLAMRRSARVAA